MSLACLTLLAFAGLYPWEKIRRVPLYLILLPRRFWWPYSIALPSIFSWGLIHDRKLTTNLLRRWLNQLAKPKVLKWIESTRGTNGSWEDCPMVTGTVSLAHVLCGMPAEHVAPGLSYLLATRRVDGSWAFLESIGHSVTTYILDGFEKVGMSDHPCVKTARDWLLASYHDEPFAPLGFPGGWWSWTVPANWADIEDTAGAITVLLRSGVSASHPYVRKACDSLCKLQNRDGSWPTYVKDAHTPVDKPCPGVTVGVVLALHSCCDAPERARYLSAIDRALAYLPRAQRSDGGLHSQWFSQVYSVGQVLGAYAMLSRANEPVARKCRAWLLEHQHVDGSWSEDADQAGTVEDTAWALNALATLGVDAPDEALDRAATWLVQRQNCDGSWPPSPVCGYSIGGRYSDDHVANGFALQALGRYRRLRKEHT